MNTDDHPLEVLARELDSGVMADLSRDLVHSERFDRKHFDTVSGLGLLWGDGANGPDNLPNRLIYSVSWAYCFVRLRHD